MYDFKKEAQSGIKLCQSVRQMIEKSVSVRTILFQKTKCRSDYKTYAVSNRLFEEPPPYLLPHRVDDAISIRFEDAISIPQTTHQSSNASASSSLSSASSLPINFVAGLVSGPSKPTPPNELLQLVGKRDYSTHSDNLVVELETVLGFISYLEKAAHLSRVVLKRELSAVESSSLECQACGTKDIFGDRARLFLCSHLLCKSCARSAQASQVSQFEDLPGTGRICPVCSKAQPFLLQDAPIIKHMIDGDNDEHEDSSDEEDDISEEEVEEDDYVSEHEEEGGGGTHFYNRSEKALTEIDSITESITKDAIKERGLKIGVQVARLVPGYGAVLGVIRQVRQKNHNLVVEIEEYCRTWLQPYDLPIAPPSSLAFKLSLSSFKEPNDPCSASASKCLKKQSAVKDGAETGAEAATEEVGIKEEEVDYSKMKVAELKELLNEQNLSTMGVKAVLIQRLKTTQGPSLPNKKASDVLSKRKLTEVDEDSDEETEVIADCDWRNKRVVRSIGGDVRDLDNLIDEVKLARRLTENDVDTDKGVVDDPLKPPAHENIHITGFGSKIDALTKALVTMKDENPNTKSLVFSQWADALDLVQEALTCNGICSLILTGGKSAEETLKRFKGVTTTS
eukprot:CAMPEP_0114396888 /NCGR_PEP_ID=MMETSP0102-20121206/13869_1 /TAXON_ID=38822 ORGANISM="Pteridomonas danica, Strain PT" /NCGR_SAMPLE_ID=MMETSP0102 /ASSEMBLY_ACC=CAM_ASM_000212 /LENGTH=622 /DNA_ID=CAMNT_0001557759 /DNA_START=332 /DNA_END=2196 /DNA_ORIENTATION=-